MYKYLHPSDPYILLPTEQESSRAESINFLTSDVSDYMYMHYYIVMALNAYCSTSYGGLYYTWLAPTHCTLPHTPTPHTDKSVFGVPLLTNVQRTGRALPPSILAALHYLTQGSGLDTKGLFRRGASKAKIDGLKLLTEANPDLSDYSNFTCYEVADMIKLYFRQLPESLLTSKLSETLIMIEESESLSLLWSSDLSVNCLFSMPIVSNCTG